MSTYIYINDELHSVFVLDQETPEAGRLLGYMEAASKSQNPSARLFLVQGLLEANGLTDAGHVVHSVWPPPTLPIPEPEGS